MAETSLNVQPREDTGKQAAKHLRAQGVIPAIVYGGDDAPEPLGIDRRELMALLHGSGRNTVVNLTIGMKKKSYKTFIYDIQHDPLTGDITHVDLKRIKLDEKINVSIPVHLAGEAIGVKSEGGIVEHQLHAIDISCLPTNIPEDFRIDITDLHMGDVIHVSDLKQESFDILSDSDSVVVHIVAPKITAILEEEEEGLEELEEGAEPELIGAEKDRDEEEE